jgi:hypothetical protein
MTRYTALEVLRKDVRDLSPIAARWACVYLASVPMPDLWASALLNDLNRQADGEPWADFDDLVEHLGQPGAWTPAADVGSAFDMRLFIASVRALVGQHKCPPPPIG